MSDIVEPFSSKIVTASDAAHELAMETKSLEKFPVFGAGELAKTIYMFDDKNKRQLFRLRIRSGKYKKPVLSAGWRKFVEDNNVIAGFKVGFFKEIDGATGEETFKIRVAPPVLLFGAVIGYAPFTRGD